MSTAGKHEPTEAIRQEARKLPGGWIYKIGGGFDADDAVPPQAIVGAWKIGPDGQIVGDFIPNPNYRASCVKQWTDYTRASGTPPSGGRSPRPSFLSARTDAENPDGTSLNASGAG